jgi:hypothetical protein
MKFKTSYVNDRVAADIMDCSPQTLRNWRFLGKGPPYTKLGGRAVRYSVDDLVAYMERRKIRTADDE